MPHDVLSQLQPVPNKDVPHSPDDQAAYEKRLKAHKAAVHELAFEGGVLSLDKLVSAIMTGKELVVVDSADLSHETNGNVKIEVKSDLSDSYDNNVRPAQETKQVRDDDYGR